MWLLLLQAFWFIAAAYASNAFPPLMRGQRPIDGGKMFGGARFFGDGKTWEGLLGGIIFGVFIGSLQIYGQSYIPPEYGLAEMTFPIVFLLAVGAMAGDLIGSFIKRRTGIKRGEKALMLDQLGFLLIAFVFVSPVYLPGLNTFIILVVLTPVIHWLANILGYVVKVKRNPW